MIPWNYVAIGFLILAGTVYTAGVFLRMSSARETLAVAILWVSLMLALGATVLDKYGG